MADKRKYYYLKLKESYFDDDAIVLLESMPDGILYSNILLKLYLKSLKNGGKLQLDEIELMIGQSSTEAERKRAARLENRALAQSRTNGGHLSDICPPEIEIEKEIDIEIEKEGERKTEQAPARCHGRYENVLLSDTELSELQAELPDKWEFYIDRLSGYIASTGRKYQNHAATIRRWAAADTAGCAPKQGMPNYTYKEGESL